MINMLRKISEAKNGLAGVVLNVTTLCNANCIYCPLHKSEGITLHTMPFSHVKKIIKEISSKDFRKYHAIKHIILSSGGDPFMHKGLIDILKLIRSELPDIRIVCFTNFSQFTKDKSEIILREHLIDHVKCNIDGSTDINYYNVKKMPLKNVESNLEDFLEIRKRLNSRMPLDIKVLTLQEYIRATYNRFGFYPAKLKNMAFVNIPDDFPETKDKYIKKIDPRMDKLYRQTIMFWAEREKVAINKIEYSRYTCPFLYFVKRTMIINADGSWSACIHDSENKLVLGNIILQSINSIYFSKKRQKLITALENKQFSKIGTPCNTVNCCCVEIPSSDGEYSFRKQAN